MRLTKFSDYVLRVLILAGNRGSTRTTVEEAAAFYDISQTHLKKVVAFLAAEGVIITTRGHHGGFILSGPPEAINLGQVLRKSEPDLALFECYRDENACRIDAVCRLKRIGHEGIAGFFAAFDRYTLADVLVDVTLLPPPSGGPLAGERLPPDSEV